MADGVAGGFVATRPDSITGWSDKHVDQNLQPRTPGASGLSHDLRARARDLSAVSRIGPIALLLATVLAAACSGGHALRGRPRRSGIATAPTVGDDHAARAATDTGPWRSYLSLKLVADGVPIQLLRLRAVGPKTVPPACDAAAGAELPAGTLLRLEQRRRRRGREPGQPGWSTRRDLRLPPSSTSALSNDVAGNQRRHGHLPRDAARRAGAGSHPARRRTRSQVLWPWAGRTRRAPRRPAGAGLPRRRARGRRARRARVVPARIRARQTLLPVSAVNAVRGPVVRRREDDVVRDGGAAEVRRRQAALPEDAPASPRRARRAGPCPATGRRS